MIPQTTAQGFDPDQTVGSIVARYPNTSRVFERFSIDYCCGGGRSLRDSCARRAIEPGMVLAALEKACAAPSGEPDVLAMSMTQLADHIEATHHAMLRSELPRLAELAARVEKAHGSHRPEVARVKVLVETFAADLFEHMAKEERILFPALRKLEREGVAAGWIVSGAIRCMIHEHEDAGHCLEELRRLTDGFRPPLDACAKHRALLAGLHDLELDMHRHVHKENSVLFVRAAEAIALISPERSGGPGSVTSPADGPHTQE